MAETQDEIYVAGGKSTVIVLAISFETSGGGKDEESVQINGHKGTWSSAVWS